MRGCAARYPLALTAIWLAASVLAVEAQAEIEFAAWELSGRVSLESRYFPRTGIDPSHQSSNTNGFVVEPKLYVEEAEGSSFTLVPFFRYDSADSVRTHWDLREAYVLLFGELGEGEWEVRVGADRVFWGVAESQHLVDIVNQIDFLEHPNGEVTLGQPMMHVTWTADWGTFEFFGLPYHRPRIYPGQGGRLRFAGLLDDDRVEYESGAEEWHPDFAARYSHSFGPLDIGLSMFNGTSREASLICMPPACQPTGVSDPSNVWIPYYAQIRQFGLDAQLTLDAWLFKFEAMHRSGDRNAFGREQEYGKAYQAAAVGAGGFDDLVGTLREEEYVAAVVGGEYTFYSVFGSTADLGLLAEWNYDERGRKALPRRQPMTLDNDFFVGAHLAFNDVESTEITAAFFTDASRATRTVGVEFDRRLSDQWSLHAESSLILSMDPDDIQWVGRRDSFFEFHLEYNF
ncbi:MAG: hypothetical protein OXB94_00845 [Nitrospira sp.]|nr:hypothetical protein [Nitrospira sp.]